MEGQVNHEAKLRDIAGKIVDGRCVAFIGAGFSSGFQPLGDQLKEEIIEKFQIYQSEKERKAFEEKEKLTLDQAAYLVHKSGRMDSLEEFINSEIEEKTCVMPTSYKVLSMLNFSGYISMNFDTLLERALEEEGRAFHVMNNDKDVFRLSRDKIPVVKLHGSIRNSPIITTAQMDDIDDEKPVLYHYLISLLARNSVVYIGFSMRDTDFREILRYLRKKILNRFRYAFNNGFGEAKDYAIMRDEKKFLPRYLEDYGIESIIMDQDKFVKDLEKCVYIELNSRYDDEERWIKDPFFDKKFLGYIPTETEVIDAIVDRIYDRLEESKVHWDRLKDIVENLIGKIMKSRKSFSKLKNYYGKKIVPLFEQDNREERMKIVKILRDELEKTKKDLKEKARVVETIIADKTEKRILLFSRSDSVFSLLSGISENFQKNIVLYVAECRPRSAEPFKDANSMVKWFKKRSTKFKICLVDDATALHLLDKESIELVLLGAVRVDLNGEEKKCFWNTCGSSAIVQVAANRRIPVRVVYDSTKNYHLNVNGEPESYSEDPQDDMFKEIKKVYSSYDCIDCRNIGHESIDWGENIASIEV